MSTAAAPGSPAKLISSDGRRSTLIKGGVFGILFLALLAGGFVGRHQVMQRLAVAEVASIRDQLQQCLDEESSLSAAFSQPARIEGLVNSLKAGLVRVDLSKAKAGELDLRLCKATLANAEKRFSDALTILNGSETSWSDGSLGQVNQARGDAFSGQGQWLEAAKAYEASLKAKPGRSGVLGRWADCQFALGNFSSAFSGYEEIAATRLKRGDAALGSGEKENAMGQYLKASEMLSRIVEREWRTNAATQLGMASQRLGALFLANGNMAQASLHLQKAIELQSRLLKEGQGVAGDLAVSRFHLGDARFAEGRLSEAILQYGAAIDLLTPKVGNDLENVYVLARSHNHCGNALLAQAKASSAVEHYEKAIAILGEGNKYPVELAASLNSRGVVRRAQSRLEEAAADFDRAISILTPLIGKSFYVGPKRDPRVLAHLDVSIVFNERGLDVLPRTRTAFEGEDRSANVALATALKNRAYTQQLRGKSDVALADLQRAIEIYTRLVEQEQQKDLAGQLGKTVSSLAWIYSTSPEDAARNAGKAVELAKKGCELTEWKLSFAIETLAAACAESGNFAEAVKWQEKAIEVAPREQKTELRARLEQYKGGAPFRTMRAAN